MGGGGGCCGDPFNRIAPQDSYHSTRKLKEVEEEMEQLRLVARDHAYVLQQRDEAISLLEGERAKLKGLLRDRDDQIFGLMREKEVMCKERDKHEGKMEELRAELKALTEELEKRDGRFKTKMKEGSYVVSKVTEGKGRKYRCAYMHRSVLFM